LEAGYLVSPALSLAVDDQSADPPDQRLNVQGAELGSLDRSGVFIQTSAFARF
jgi:hypothetical protein